MTSPLRPAVAAFFFDFTARFEGIVPHFYNDVLGLTTIGAGQLYRTAQEAIGLPLRRPDGSPASCDEILDDWQRVHDDPTAARLGHTRAAQVAQLHLDPADLRRLVGERRDVMAAALARRFPGFEALPADGQLGLMSLAWAAGSGFRYPKLEAAVKAGDWTTAAAESAIRDNAPRTAVQKRLFEAAARVVAEGGDFDVLTGWP